MKISTRKMFYIATLVVATTCSTSVWAQQRNNRMGGGFMGMMSGGGMSPDYMIRDLPRFEEALDLTSEQVLIVEQILRDYDESFKEASDASRESMRNAMQAMRGNEDDPARQQSLQMRDQMRQITEKMDSAGRLGDEEGMTELRERLKAQLDSLRDEMRQVRVEQWQSPQRQGALEEIALFLQDQLRLKRTMRNELEGDLVSILTEDQQELWPPLERQLIRDRLLPRGRISGETVDVIGLVEQQQFEDEQLKPLLPVLSSWDIDVTAALTARDDYMVEHQGQMMSAMRTMDTNASIEVMAAQTRLAEVVRDINDTSIQEITLLLQEDVRGTFEKVAKERGYPRIFRTTRAERAFQEAMAIEDLEPDILQGIAELYEAFLIDIAYSNEKIYEMTHRWEAQEQLDRMNRFAQRMTGGSSARVESPIREAENDRRTIEDQYIEQLKMLLTQEQIETITNLVTRSERGARGTNGGRNRGGGGFAGGREEFMKRFDKNGDGTIDESERESIRNFFRNGGGQNGGGQNGGGQNGGGRN